MYSLCINNDLLTTIWCLRKRHPQFLYNTRRFKCYLYGESSIYKCLVSYIKSYYAVASATVTTGTAGSEIVVVFEGRCPKCGPGSERINGPSSFYLLACWLLTSKWRGTACWPRRQLIRPLFLLSKTSSNHHQASDAWHSRRKSLLGSNLMQQAALVITSAIFGPDLL